MPYEKGMWMERHQQQLSLVLWILILVGVLNVPLRAARPQRDQNNVRLTRVVGVKPPFILHDGDDDLGVAHIHLTTVGLYEQFLPLPQQRA